MTLAESVAACTERALRSGALAPIETEESRIDDGGMRFLVRRLSTLRDKEQLAHARAAAAKREGRRAVVDPFDPPEAELTVADLSPTHVAVLNKFPVLGGHLLVVTRAFADQEELLGGDDMAALALGLAEIDGLGFYNGGAEAGASQRHKHLQIVPLPLAPDGPRVPVETLIDAEPRAGAAGAAQLAALPFAHAFTRVDAADPAALLDAYWALLAAAGLHAADGRASSPYNLLVARRWMLLVPRSQERFGTISVNALGFAGSLFVRDDAELAALRRAGPMAALVAVARPRAAL